MPPVKTIAEKATVLAKVEQAADKAQQVPLRLGLTPVKPTDLVILVTHHDQNPPPGPHDLSGREIRHQLLSIP